ncbi:hypothetical protein [Scatolibacter rhodanostii]|uniref:hypothetical protein n=1 Tax=Scatolibacter rhodanostii TaxID=2014781 RepID=UPI000C08CDA7|nr:hypothetical protein [Scatolibacter rhodanostii]
MSPRMVELHDIDVPEFLKVLDSCEGQVYLMTRDGDRLNLNSKLSQLVGLTTLIEGGKIAEAFIMCEKEEDESKLFRFNLYKDGSFLDAE